MMNSNFMKHVHVLVLNFKTSTCIVFICNKKLHVKQIVNTVNWIHFIMETIDVIISV